MLHYGYTAISNYEAGRNEPSLRDLKSLAEFFDVSVDYLIGVTDLKRGYQDDSPLTEEMKWLIDFYNDIPADTQMDLKILVRELYSLLMNHFS